MSIKKKTLAVMVALSVGASFGALANGSDTGHSNGLGHQKHKIVKHEEVHNYYWKNKRGRYGSGIRTGDITYTSKSLNVRQRIDSTQRAELGDVDFNWDQKDNKVKADADAKANPDLTSSYSKKRRYHHYPTSEADLDSNSANGGTARAMMSASMKVKTGNNTNDNSGAFHGIGAQTAVSGMNVSVQNSVNVNAANF
ncbi:hypothetical protein [Oceanimonas marisflavi]|uniref:hypothetical protein n=1 Tax=Oceanimonas marisflavi TaxID=2059724 RepID=UPI001300A422|nr:hypothetical protein [Oceanimonas marisflavi]